MNNTPQNPLDSLKLLVERCGSQREAAARLGISPQYVNDILVRNRDISSRVSLMLGWEKVITYIPTGYEASLLPGPEDADRPIVIEKAG